MTSLRARSTLYLSAQPIVARTGHSRCRFGEDTVRIEARDEGFRTDIGNKTCRYFGNVAGLRGGQCQRHRARWSRRSKNSFDRVTASSGTCSTSAPGQETEPVANCSPDLEIASAETRKGSPILEIIE